MNNVHSGRIANPPSSIYSESRGSSISLQPSHNPPSYTHELSSLPSRPIPAPVSSRPPSYTESNPPPIYSFSETQGNPVIIEMPHHSSTLNKLKQRSTTILIQTLYCLYGPLFMAGIGLVALGRNKTTTIAGATAIPISLIWGCLAAYHQVLTENKLRVARDF